MIGISILKMEGLHSNDIFINTARQVNVATTGRAAYEACSAMCNLGNNSAFVLGLWKTTDNLHRVCPSQDLPDVEA
jgi:hypothetical protein